MMPENYDDRNPRPITPDEIAADAAEMLGQPAPEPPYRVKIAGFQHDVGAWSEHNFDWLDAPDWKAGDPLLGLAEEVGELAEAHLAGLKDGSAIGISEYALAAVANAGALAHDVLKARQGIRGTEEEHKSNAIRHMHRLIRSLIAVGQELGLTDFMVINAGHFGPLTERKDPSTVPALKADAVGDIAVYLADYCERNQLEMEESVNHTWSRPIDPETGKGGVRFRDWKVNSADGGGHASV